MSAIERAAPSWSWGLFAFSALALSVALVLWSGARATNAPSGKSVSAVVSSAATALAAAQPSNAELELLRAQVAGLRDQVLESERARQQGQAAASDSAPLAPPPSPPLEGPEIRARYDQLFDGELADLNWARTERQTLASFFDADPGSVRVDSLECKRTVCRAHLGFEGRAARDRFLAKIGLPPLDKGTFWNSNPEGTSVTLFTAREGQPLPDVSQE